MRLVLFRHGRTVRNDEDRFQGQCDPPLSDTGRTLIQQAAEALAASRGHWTGIHCSPQRRATQTATILGLALGLGPLPNPDLRERHLGELDGLSRADFAAEYPERMRQLVADLDHRPPGGESAREVRHRITVFATGLLTGSPRPGDVLVVTHGGVLNVVRRHLLAGPGPTGMVGPGRAVVLDLSADSHDRPRMSLAAWDVAAGDIPSRPAARRSIP